MCLLSSLDKIDVRVEWISDDVCEANGYKPGFLSVGVDSFDRLFLFERQMSLSMVAIITKI